MEYFNIVLHVYYMHPLALWIYIYQLEEMKMFLRKLKHRRGAILVSLTFITIYVLAFAPMPHKWSIDKYMMVLRLAYVPAYCPEIGSGKVSRTPFVERRALVCSTISPSLEPHQCLLIGTWKRLAWLPCWPSRGWEVLHQRWTCMPPTKLE